VTTSNGAQIPQPTGPEVPEQAGKILSQFAGYVGFKTIEIGLNHGLFEACASTRAVSLPTNWRAKLARMSSTPASGARLRTAPGSWS